MPSSELKPDYVKLVRFLLEPLLNPTESISVDCEQLNSTKKVWLRLAIKAADKAHIYGRGNRNLEAIRKVLNAAAFANKQSLYLDIYGGEATQESTNKESESKKSLNRRSGNSKSKT